MIGPREDGMAEVRDRDRTAAPRQAAPTRARPVVLGTLSVRIDPAAEEMAIASALEAGAPLIVANMLHLPPYPGTVMLPGAGGATLPPEGAPDEVRATPAPGAAPGIRAGLVRGTSRQPARALPRTATGAQAG